MLINIFALLSFAILSCVLFAFWNAFPSIQWIKVIFWGVFDDILNSIWIFIISTLFILLYPPLSTIISGFYLDPISHKTNLLLGNKYMDNSSHISGIIAGIRILGLSTLIFILILLLKWTLISNIYLVIFLQFLASGYIIGKEYYEIVALKIFTYEKISLFRKKNFLALNIIGSFCSLLFVIPFLMFSSDTFKFFRLLIVAIAVATFDSWNSPLRFGKGSFNPPMSSS